MNKYLTVNEYFFDLYDRMIGDVHIPSVLREVADVVCQSLNAERATIYLIDRQTHQLESAAIIGNVARTIRIPIRKSSLAGFCAETARSFLVPDAYGDLSPIDPNLRFDPAWDQLNHFRTRDVMCAPALFKGQVMGVAQVLNSNHVPFGPLELTALRNISRLIGYALYHARLYDDIASLKQLEKEKAQFMRVMVHELKSPIAAAKMLAVVLRDYQSHDPQIGSMATKITSRIDQMNDLIKDMLDLASVKSGEPLGQITELDLTAETERCCSLYREPAEKKGLTLTVQLPEIPLPVRIDSRGYQLVVSNLVSNAVKYTPAGSVTVTLIAQDSCAVLTVADTGMGIPPDDIPRLFREFFRASNAKKSRISGSGVGLAGAKNIVERFGGQMELSSTENHGSSFTVRLPLCKGNF